MDAFIDLSWRAYPGGVVLAAGVAMLVHGLRVINFSGRRSQPVSLVLGIRMVIFGVVLAGLAGAWIWHQLWLLALALAFGGEEALETSIVLYALRRGHRIEREWAARSTRGPLAHGPAVR